MNIERGFPLLEMHKLRMYLLKSSESPRLGVQVCLSPLFPTPFISLMQLNFHVTSRLAWTFTLGTPLGFFMSFLRIKRELTTKQGDALGLSCALSELSQFSTFLQDFFFQFLHQFSPKHLKCSYFIKRNSKVKKL